MINMIPIHEAMVKAREAKGWSRGELAHYSGVPACGLLGYETGKSAPGLFNLISLADALGISLDEYVGREVKGG